MREPWECSPENVDIPGVQELPYLEDNTVSTRHGQGEADLGGVFDHSACKEDGPGTWEALASLKKRPVPRRPGNHSPTRSTFAACTSNRPSSQELRKE